MRTVTGLHHVTAIAGPAQENLDFYTGVLGMRLVKRSVNQDDPGTYHLFYADAVGHPGTDLTFFPWAHQAPGREGHGLAAELSLAVPPGSVEFWSDRLTRYGTAHQGFEMRFGDRTLPFVDPHGLRVALVERADAMTRAFAPWNESPIAVEHQVRGLEGARLGERDLTLATSFLEQVLGFRHLATENGWHRYGVLGGGSGQYVDVCGMPNARRGAWASAPCITSRGGWTTRRTRGTCGPGWRPRAGGRRPSSIASGSSRCTSWSLAACCSSWRPTVPGSRSTRRPITWARRSCCPRGSSRSARRSKACCRRSTSPTRMPGDGRDPAPPGSDAASGPSGRPRGQGGVRRPSEVARTRRTGGPRPAGRDSGDEAALPIARRLAKVADRRFPLFWRPSWEVERLPMVHWFDPRQLLDAGLKKLVSTIIGARSDQRIVQALASRRRELYDYTYRYRGGREGPYIDRTHPREEIWIDYVCDTGDGWNSTYAVAYTVSQPELEVLDDNGTARRLKRGNLLVFGGDEVYPTPSREAYHQRLIVPYEQAFGDSQPPESPHVFAIPGNHDWYDGLTAFARLFCSGFGGRHFAGWRTRQRRSYFALKLPGRWWLIGSDGQLQSDIDTPQIEYFRQIADRHMQPGDRVIVCLASPGWIYAHKYRQLGGHLDETDLLYLRNEVFARRGVTMDVFLSGDYHHYRRHEEIAPADPARPIQKITAGGGGAFLHPTHDEDVTTIEEACITPDEPPRSFELKASYPDVRRSSRLTFGNLLFTWRNFAFGIVPTVIYLLTAWIVSSAMAQPQPHGLLEAAELTLRAFQHNPGLTLWVGSVTIGLVLFTDTHSRIYKWLGGLAHAAAHWACLFALGWSAMLLSRLLLPYWGLGRFALVALLVGLGAWVLGSAIVGLYLLISLNVFGRHSEEAFSSLRIEDYKHFLRLHIAPDGCLTIYPIAIERVPRRWRPRPDGAATPSRLVPGEPLEPKLIEPPIVLGRPRGLE